MKPSILPPFTSAIAASFVCGPPWLMSSFESHGRVHPACTSGFGTHTLGLPSAPSAKPSAPGNVPKYWSNDRFSCITITMCLILPSLGSVEDVVVPVAGELAPTPVSEAPSPGDVWIVGAPPVQAARTSAVAATVAAVVSARRNRREDVEGAGMWALLQASARPVEDTHRKGARPE